MDNNQPNTNENQDPQPTAQPNQSPVAATEENKSEDSTQQGQQQDPQSTVPKSTTEENVTVTNIVPENTQNVSAESENKKEDEKQEGQDTTHKNEQQSNPVNTDQATDKSTDQNNASGQAQTPEHPQEKHEEEKPESPVHETKPMETVIPVPVSSPSDPIRPPVPPGGGSIPPRGPAVVQPTHNHAIYFLVSVITLIVGLVFGYLIHLTMAQDTHDQSSSQMMANEQALMLPADVQKVSACVSNKGALYNDPQVSNGPTYIVYKGKVIGLEYVVPQASLKTGSLDYLGGDNMKVDHIVVSNELPQKGEIGDTNDIVDLYSISRTTQMEITCPQITPAVSVQPASSSAQPTQGPNITPSAGGGTVNPGGVMIPAESTPSVPASPTVAPAP